MVMVIVNKLILFDAKIINIYLNILFNKFLFLFNMLFEVSYNLK